MCKIVTAEVQGELKRFVSLKPLIRISLGKGQICIPQCKSMGAYSAQDWNIFANTPRNVSCMVRQWVLVYLTGHNEKKNKTKHIVVAVNDSLNAC